jgi:glycosyltransferase involved in cell wall biosynthesis
MTLSLCMIVRNEEANLPRCLDSVRGLAGEIIVVDTGSADSTALIAVGHGAKVLPFDFGWIDFAAARNFALERATSPWILVLDADETLDRSSLPMIENLVSLDANIGYFLERHNHSLGSQLSTRDYVVRLFPNRPEYRYSGRVHETVDASIVASGGRLHQTRIRIDHRFSMDPEARRRKNHHYIAILREEIAADPDDISRLSFLAAEYHQLGLFDEAAAIAEHIASATPLDARAQLFAGIYHLLYKPDLLRARSDFQRALHLRPAYPEALSFLQLLEDREQAIAKS